MSEPFVGEIRMVGFNFAPRGWATCDGQLMPIAQNTSLFSLLGTTYGGDGRTTFALPDLRGRVPMHAGTGPGLSRRSLGDKGGTELATLVERPREEKLALTELREEGFAENNTQPYLVVNFVIALVGLYPPRD